MYSRVFIRGWLELQGHPRMGHEYTNAEQRPFVYSRVFIRGWLKLKLMVATNIINSLYRFIGYGTPSAPLWFLGREESLVKRLKQPGWTLDWELSVRASWQPVMDARQAHEQLCDPYWLEAQLSPVWVFAARLQRGLLHTE